MQAKVKRKKKEMSLFLRSFIGSPEEVAGVSSKMGEMGT